jgi:hypothetical protein
MHGSIAIEAAAGLGSFLVSGVVSPSLPAEFAIPAAYGDLGATVLALAGLSGAGGPHGFGDTDPVGAQSLGLDRFVVCQIGPGMLGAAYLTPVVIVPGLLASHAMMLRPLLRGIPAKKNQARSDP